MAPFDNARQLVPKQKIEHNTQKQETKGVAFDTTSSPSTRIWMQEDKTLIGFNEHVKEQKFGILSLNSPADFFDLSFADLMFMLIGFVTGKITGIIKIYQRCCPNSGEELTEREPEEERVVIRKQYP